MEKRRNRPPTIHDVARTAAVSVMTVSRVLNNNPSVKQVTRSRVMNAIHSLGYAPNDAARMLKGRSSRTIALVVPTLSDFFASCFHAVQQVAIERGYQTLVVVTGRDSAVEDQQIESLMNHRVSGLILVTIGADTKSLRSFRENGIPVVALDRPITAPPTDTVLVENREGAELGVWHLIEHGHTRIACVSLDSGSYTTQERVEGYMQAMRAAKLDPILCTSLSGNEAMRALVARWAASPDRPTAVFATKRIATVQLIQALHRHSLRVPQEIALVGFDDFELAEVLSTPLTAVRQSPTEIARAAAELLFKRITAAQDKTRNDHPCSKIFFPAELIIRRSCGCSAKD